MKTIVRVGIPAIISIILLVLYFVLEKAEKITKDKSAEDCLLEWKKSKDDSDTSLNKGDRCYVFKNDTCYKGTIAWSYKDIQDIAKMYEDSDSRIPVNALAGQFCQLDEVYKKYDILLYFGIFFALVAIVMNFVDVKF